jgi:hypothetical protein
MKYLPITKQTIELMIQRRGKADFKEMRYA